MIDELIATLVSAILTLDAKLTEAEANRCWH